MRAARKLEAMLQESRRVLAVERQRHQRLSERLAEERLDVEKLEGLTLTGLFSRVMGTREERLSQERQEFLAAKLKCEQSQQAFDDASHHVDRLQRELKDYADVDQEYAQLLSEKEQLILEAQDDKTAALLMLSEQMADVRSDAKGYREAIKAGEASTAELREVMSTLKKAEEWGQWDLLGGSLVSTLAKHSKLDSAKTHARQAQQHLWRFKRELADVSVSLNASLQIDALSKFTDLFFDGLIADWMMQSKIKKASEACLVAMSRVGTAVDTCRRALSEKEKHIETLDEKRVALIEQG